MPNNGFGKQPDFTRIKRLLGKAIASQNLPQVESLVRKFGEIHGTKRVVNLLIDEVLPQCPLEAQDWHWRSILSPEQYREFMDSSKAALFKVLIQQGFTPGTDFSLAPGGGFMLSSEVSAAMLKMVPEEHRARIQVDMQKYSKKSFEDPWTAVESRLGNVPFRQNLCDRLSVLVEQGRAANVLAAWIATVSCGVSWQVVGDENDTDLFGWLLRHLKAKYPEVFEEVLTVLKSDGDAIPSGDALLDMDINCLECVARAAGSSEANGEIVTIDGQGCFNRKGIERLSLVWRGSRYSPNEMLAALDRGVKNG